MTTQTIDMSPLFALMDVADEALDKDTIGQKKDGRFDAPDDAEWWVQAGTVRKIDAVFLEIDRIRRSQQKPLL